MTKKAMRVEKLIEAHRAHSVPRGGDRDRPINFDIGSEAESDEGDEESDKEKGVGGNLEERKEGSAAMET